VSAALFLCRRRRQVFRNHVSLPEFFQQKRGLFSSKWKYLPRAPGNFFRSRQFLPGICVPRKIRTGTLFPHRRKIDV
jgi:hypothetical protein